MTRATFFTDNCGKQFKCSYSFGFVGDSEVFVSGDPARRLHIEAHYYDACHGKSLSDSEGGVVKTLAKNPVVSCRMRILGSFDLFEKLAPELEFELREANATEVDEFTVKLGTAQMLMTMQVSARPSTGRVGHTCTFRGTPKTRFS